MPTSLLKPAEVAEMLGVNVETLRTWRYVGAGPTYIRVGRFPRYRPTDVEAYLSGREVEPISARVG